MRGFYVCEQSALVGDFVAEHQAWYYGSGCGSKRSNNIEMHQRSGYTSRTIGAIALRPVGNGQGSFYFMSITTGRVLNIQHSMAL